MQVFCVAQRVLVFCSRWWLLLARRSKQRTTQVKFNSRRVEHCWLFRLLLWRECTSHHRLWLTQTVQNCANKNKVKKISRESSLCVDVIGYASLSKKCHTANLPRKNDSFISAFEALTHSFWREFLSWLRKYFLDGSTRIRIVKWWDCTCTEDLQPSRESWARRLKNAKNGKKIYNLRCSLSEKLFAY